MDVIVIKSSDDDKSYLRGLRGEIVHYILKENRTFAVVVTKDGYFKTIPLSNLAKGHELHSY